MSSRTLPSFVRLWHLFAVCCLFLVTVGNPGSALAQSGKKAKKASPPVPVYQLTASGTFTWGTVDRIAIQTKARYHRERRCWSFDSSARLLYSEINGQVFDTDLEWRNIGRWFTHRRVYPWVVAIGQSSKRRQYHLRSFAGAGFSARLVYNKRAEFNWGIGLFYDYTRFYGNEFVDRVEPDAIRGLVRPKTRLFGRYQITRSLSATHEIFYTLNPTDFSDFRLRVDTTAALAINRWLSLRASLDVNYESVIPVGSSQYDVLWLWGIGISGS